MPITSSKWQKSEHWEENKERRESRAGISATKGSGRAKRLGNGGEGRHSTQPCTVCTSIWWGQKSSVRDGRHRLQQKQATSITTAGGTSRSKDDRRHAPEKWELYCLTTTPMLCSFRHYWITAFPLYTLFLCRCSLYSPYVQNRWINAVAQWFFLIIVGSMKFLKNFKGNTPCWGKVSQCILTVISKHQNQESEIGSVLLRTKKRQQTYLKGKIMKNWRRQRGKVLRKGIWNKQNQVKVCCIHNP